MASPRRGLGLRRRQRPDRPPQPALSGRVAAADEPAHGRLRAHQRAPVHARPERPSLDPRALPGRVTMETLEGNLLIASPSIYDPNFRRTVVLLTAHTEDGAIGLILNRRSETTIEEAVPQLAALIGSDEPIFAGGPVNPNGVAMLAEFEDATEAGVEVFGDIGFVALDASLEGEAPALRRRRVFAASCARWRPRSRSNGAGPRTSPSCSPSFSSASACSGSAGSGPATTIRTRWRNGG